MSDKKKESWMNSKWRPAMGWMYMAVCITDFILYPVLWAIFQNLVGITPIKPWEPLTLQGAGLFHIAMGAVLGVTAWSRGQEKISGVAGVSGIPMSYSSKTYEEPTQGYRFAKLARPAEPNYPEL